jgi:hypothetical protein
MAVAAAASWRAKDEGGLEAMRIKLARHIDLVLAVVLVALPVAAALAAGATVFFR